MKIGKSLINDKKSGRMGITMFPKVESDLAYSSATLPVGVTVEDTIAKAWRSRSTPLPRINDPTNSTLGAMGSDGGSGAP